jgi:uncharacterized damage-inducible protein DinB
MKANRPGLIHRLKNTLPLLGTTVLLPTNAGDSKSTNVFRATREEKTRMAIKEALLPEYDHEMAVTRKVLERIPLAEAMWKPHVKSMSLGELATHIVEIPGWAGTIVNQPSLDMAGGEGTTRPTYSSTDQMLKAFDENVAKARAAIESKSDAEMMSPWELKRAGKIMFTIPKVAVLRSFLLNHLIHHRGQCSVYIRIKDVPVPSIYGPSADESPF